MDAKKTVVFVAAAGLIGGLVAYVMKKKAANEELETPHAVNSGKGHKKVAKVVEKTLHKHEGEDSPVVQAFQEALQAEK